jgi:protoporphyrinogen oxidase
MKTKSDNRSPKRRIVILGGGITGLSLAEKLLKENTHSVIVLEKQNYLGGFAATLNADGIAFDIGSHRIHPSIPKNILHYIKTITKNSLLEMPRNGKLYFQGSYIDYPPKISNFIKTMGMKKIFRIGSSLIAARLIDDSKGNENFQTAMTKLVGKELYDAFYDSYARKLWGHNPAKMSMDAAGRRKLFLATNFLRPGTFKKRKFFYPHMGIGQITKSVAKRFVENQGTILDGIRLKQVKVEKQNIKQISIEDSDSGHRQLDVDVCISTIPIDDLHRLVFPNNWTPKIEWRAIRLVILLFDKQISTDSETYYFPSTDVTVGRVSDIRKYSATLNPGLTGTLLTIEIPCNEYDEIWEKGEADLVRLCVKELKTVNLLKSIPAVTWHHSMRFKKVYPIYDLHWKDGYSRIYDELMRIENLFTIGRSGLFLHCNIDHCIAQASEMSTFLLNSKSYDKSLWNKKVTGFYQMSARD